MVKDPSTQTSYFVVENRMTKSQKDPHNWRLPTKRAVHTNFTFHIPVEHGKHGSTRHDHFQQDPVEYGLD